ncbi:invasin domain 3-containing protein [Paenibacillus sp. SI8]|uniref:invasin domain 3-containing protein n=1 Tax=unclassified Paenibacillus TaxID=185978 RepID=UPI0034664774
MKEWERHRRWMAMALIIVVIFGLWGGYAVAADSAVLDQEQSNGSGNVWVNHDYQRYQTFTPAITGNLSKMDLRVFDSYGPPGAIQLSIYKESDLSTPLATAQLASFGAGWVSIDFSGTQPYLKKETMYRMVASTENGGSAGFGWYIIGGNSYTRGGSAAVGYDFAFRSYMIADHSISLTGSEVSSARSSLVADGTSQTTITVKLRDAQDDALTTGGETVAITSTLGTVSAVSDNHDGTYAATLTAPTVVGTATISASVGGSALASTASVQLVPGAPSAANSTVEAGATTLTADGTSQTTVSVKLKDAQGHAVATGGATVAITSTIGTVSAVSDNHDGTYAATLTASMVVGTATISASVGGSVLATTASVQFVPGAPSTANSTVEAGATTLTADGTSQTTVTVKLKDAQGHVLTTGGAAVAITSTLGTVSAVSDNHDGTYTATLTAPMAVGTATISASVGGSVLATTASVQFVPGAPSTVNSTVEADAATLTADGTSQTTVTVKLKDAQGHALTTSGAVVAITSTIGTVSAVSDNHDGTYTATLTAPMAVGTATISASVGGSALASTASVQFVPGEVSPSRSTVTASDLVVRADGSSKASVFVKLKDGYDHPISGKRVWLEADGGRSVIQNVYGLTDENGLSTFLVSNTAAESVTYFAKEETSGLVLEQTVNIRFSYDQPPNIQLQADPIVSTFGGVTVTVTASVYGDFNRVSSMKWAAGSHPVSYFDTQGTEITNHFTVHENGIYSVYVVDTAGNANVRLLDVQNIVPLSSNASLNAWQLTGLGGTIKFDFDPDITDYAVSVSYSVYGLQMKLTPSDVYSAVYVNGLQVISNAVSHEYSLATGKNAFEVSVKAQDGSTKTYTLNVTRSAANATSDSPSSSSAASPSSQPSSNDSPKVRINDLEISGIASLQVDSNGAKSIEIRLDMNTLKKVLDSLAATTEVNLSISMEEQAEQAALRLSGEVVAYLASKAATISLETQHGHYRLPLADVANQASDWTNDASVQIVIGHDKREEIPGLQDAANKGGFQLASDPIHFNVYVTVRGERREVSSYNRYVERAIYLPADFAGTTAVIWDQKLGVRPVPTEFTKVNGRLAAVIRSLTNSIYVLVSHPSSLTDIQGHWAEAEIGDMNRRMIVHGVDGSRFAPEAAITRAELAALLARALGLESEKYTGFRDVSESSWYSGSVAAVKAYGIMDGFKGGAFDPGREVSRQEAIVTIVRALQLAKSASVVSKAGAQVDLGVYADSNQIGDWVSDAMRTAIQEGLLKGYGNELRPQKSLTRAETTVLLYRMLLKAGFIDRKA